MKKKVTISIIFLIIIIPVIFATRYFIPKKSIDDIKIIEVSKYSGFGCPVREYVIDFDKNLVTYNYTYLNRTNNDNQFSSGNFSKEDAEYFLEQANSCRFFNWKKSYKTRHGGNDLPYTCIRIIYKNGDIQIIKCDNAYPHNYDQMAEVFYEAFGYNIL